MNMSLKNTLLERIEKDNVCPRSSWFYRTREILFWSLWILSIVIGALAFAVTLFVVLRRQYTLYEATHTNFFTFFVDSLPYLWIVVFGLMAYVAVHNIRHTKKGYKYPLWMILASSVVLSFAGGAAMQMFGLGYAIDHKLGDYMAMYSSQEKIENKLWQAPDRGRLIGQQVFTTVSPTTTIIFEDKDGQRWRMEIDELHAQDIALLADGRLVRVIGTRPDESLPNFHACGVFPWMLDREVTYQQMSAEKRAFIERAYNQIHQAEERLKLLETETYASSSPKTMAVCAELASMKRIGRSVR